MAIWNAAAARLKKLGGLWLLVGAAGLGLVTLNDLGRLLTDIQVEGASAHGASVFTGLKWDFTDTSELRDAILLWRELDETAQPLLRLHAKLDLALFIPGYGFLLLLGLLHVGAGRLAWVLAGSVVLADIIETVATWILIANQLTLDGFWLGFIQLFSLLKWLSFAAALTTMVVVWVKPEIGQVSARDLTRVIGQAREGGPPHPGIALLPLVGLVALFCSVIALPAGGPLEQIPDVLRYQLSGDASGGLRVLSSLALVMLTAAVTAAGLMATHPHPTSGPPRVLLSRWVLLGAFAVSSLLSTVACVLDGEARPSPWSFVLVALAVAFAGWLADRARRTDSRQLPPAAGEAPPAKRWVGALAGAVVVAGGLGLVRAAFPPFILDLDEGAGAVPWELALAFGGLTALVGGFFTQWLVEALPQARSILRSIPVWILASPAAAAAIWLALAPAHATAWGTTGVVAIGFGAFALIIGFLKHLSRAGPVWWAPYSIGLGRRTPWLTLLVVVWGVASVMNTKGIFHDARVLTDRMAAPPEPRTLDSALTEWLETQSDSCAPRDTAPTPLILIAAPGGGIRAAYWTAATLDRLFGPGAGPCARGRLFAISGVSGGSVGAVTWLAADRLGRKGRDAVNEMSRDRSLAVAAAGLLLRDPLQPLVGLAKSRMDRAALLEEGWRRSAGVYGTAEEPLRWSDFRDTAWVPVLVLNASSVNDGCRVLVTNVDHLAAMRGGDCGASPVHGIPTGPVSGSIDPFPGLYSRDWEESAACGKGTADMRAVTAALLSARFPVVSPSGALLRCVVDSTPVTRQKPAVERRLVTYTVDGGYFENSGLLTLLQMWHAIEPRVLELNADSARPRRIVPWVIVADNHYRDRADAPPGRRPLELLVLFKALASTSNRVVSQGTLEQQARAALGSGAECLGTRGPEAVVNAVGCFAVIAPSREPTVAAPLGWVLSRTSRTDLDRRLDSILPRGRTPPDSILAELLRQLR